MSLRLRDSRVSRGVSPGGFCNPPEKTRKSQACLHYGWVTAILPPMIWRRVDRGMYQAQRRGVRYNVVAYRGGEWGVVVWRGTRLESVRPGFTGRGQAQAFVEERCV